MDIKGLNKARVLAALYNASTPLGLGFMHYDPSPMTEEQAREILNEGNFYFDYLRGRVMKINLEHDEVNTSGYNRDNGENAAETVIESLKNENSSNSDAIKKMHQKGVTSAAESVRERLNSKTTINGNVIHLGLEEFKGYLEPIIEKIEKK